MELSTVKRKKIKFAKIAMRYSKDIITAYTESGRKSRRLAIIQQILIEIDSRWNDLILEMEAIEDEEETTLTLGKLKKHQKRLYNYLTSLMKNDKSLYKLYRRLYTRIFRDPDVRDLFRRFQQEQLGQELERHIRAMIAGLSEIAESEGRWNEPAIIEAKRTVANIDRAILKYWG